MSTHATMIEVALAWTETADRSLPLPRYETAGAAGADLRANFPDRADVVLASGARGLIPTGLRLALPQGHEAQLRPRSGLALKHGVTLLNSPGTIDSDYRGEIGVLLLNTGARPFRVAHGARIAQLVVAPVVRTRFRLNTLLATVRDAGGFGSTGVD